jgi:cytochrome c peroxidase
LSSNGQQSCATCHDPEKGLADGRALAVGATGVVGSRSAPSLWNVAFQQSFFWDGRAKSLEEQMVGPLYAEAEMNNTPANLLAVLNGIPSYTRLFNDAFPSGDATITLDEIYHALAAFQTSLVSLNSRYDQYAHGYADALTENEIEGLNVFRSFVARCAECHTPPLFSNQQIAVIGTAEPEGMPRDIGAQGPSGDATMRGGFKVPSLRNITHTAPYMHSGLYDSLWDATEFYTLGRGHALDEGEPIYLHWHIWEPDLPDHEIDRLVDFMGTLNDELFKPVVPNILPSGLTHISADDFTKTHLQ